MCVCVCVCVFVFVYKWENILGRRGLWSTKHIDFLTGVVVLCQQKAGKGNWFLLHGVKGREGLK